MFTTVFSVSKILRVASVSLSRATDQTRANPSESERIRVRLDCRRYRSTILHLCDEKWWRRKRSRNRVINSIHIVRRYSWTASTQTHSRPAHKDLRENGEHGGGARNSKSVLVTCAKERLVFSSIKETLHEYANTLVNTFARPTRNQRILPCKHPARLIVTGLSLNARIRFFVPRSVLTVPYT